MFTRFNAFLAKYCMIVAVVGLYAIVAAVAYQVFGRYVMNDTPTWAESLTLVLILYVALFGAALLMIHFGAGPFSVDARRARFDECTADLRQHRNAA